MYVDTDSLKCLSANFTFSLINLFWQLSDFSLLSLPSLPCVKC